MVRFLNKIASWVTICIIYLILKIEEFWDKLNKKALALTLGFWFAFFILVRYFEHIIIWGIIIGFPLLILFVTYIAFKNLGNEKSP